ncbi:uncharacterized protein LOC125538419 [Triticum urartu]|uniref:uncharacterized protein LOC125538419 n=1 Tax=Triticum urartu TaxID=4572 RepID=UPI002043BB63|nr:uncharacterized protein LOC125538419 [Triticum urartu]
MSPAANCKRPKADAPGSFDDEPPWASLPADLARHVGWRVLAGDLLDYVRFRAVCSHWRSATMSPRGHGITDPRFHPRRWMMLPEGHGLHPAGKKRFFNISTGVFVRHRVPLLLDYNYLVFCPVEGLLLLQGNTAMEILFFSSTLSRATSRSCPDKIYPPFHLVDCDSDILLVGYTNYTLSSHRLVYRVADLIRGRVDPLTSIEGNALLIGSKTSVSVSSKAVPAIAWMEEE